MSLCHLRVFPCWSAEPINNRLSACQHRAACATSAIHPRFKRIQTRYIQNSSFHKQILFVYCVSFQVVFVLFHATSTGNICHMTTADSSLPADQELQEKPLVMNIYTSTTCKNKMLSVNENKIIRQWKWLSIMYFYSCFSSISLLKHQYFYHLITLVLHMFAPVTFRIFTWCY